MAEFTALLQRRSNAEGSQAKTLCREINHPDAGGVYILAVKSYAAGNLY